MGLFGKKNKKQVVVAAAGENLNDIYIGFEDTGLGMDMAPVLTEAAFAEFHSPAAVKQREANSRKFGVQPQPIGPGR